MAILLLVAAYGCGARQADQSSTASRSDGQSSSQVATAQDPAMRTPGYTGSARPIHQIHLTSHGCIRFEPQWTEVRVGQTVTVRSDLRKPVRIYVSPGVFARDNYLVGPGATISMGRVREAGRYSFWTEPAACREAPRGVLMAGPGVRVQDHLYASAPGTR
jgi:hypothetical protein